ncbi:BspA family leucine-rich repeat surface protein [uncultured Lactobacillus sp.]|uniref:BspA family leucine-rich repeat surface protein n=1 Tax=uncultured Lactobacillus sp. TaxID=153152 RepID=UPI00263A31DF|nr:BspA family leucine-rich repeat surface protein [uncultured Lactobacillus sp.]
MLSKNNFNEKIRQMDEKKDHFSIRKLTIGAASVLIGMTFIGINGHTVYAADESTSADNNQTSKVVQSEDKATDKTAESQKNIILDTKSANTLQNSTSLQTNEKNTTILSTKDSDKKAEVSKASQDNSQVEAATKTKVSDSKDNKDAKSLVEKTASDKVKQATTDKKDVKTATKQANTQYNVDDWDGNLNDETHEYTLTGYHGEDKQNIYIPNTSDFNNAGKISNNDKVYITKDLMKTISKAGATQIVIDSDGSDDKNKVYAKGDWTAAFADSSTLKSVDLSHLDTSDVTNMTSAFQNDLVLEDANLSGWDISKITSFNNMFSGDNVLSDVNFGGWDFGNNPTMSNMFDWTWQVKNIGLTGTKNVTQPILSKYVDGLRNSHATSVDLGKLNLSPDITSLRGLFTNDSSLENVDFTGFDASHITDMGNMFYGDGNLVNVNLGNLNFENIKTDGMFAWANNNIKNVNITNAKNISSDILNEYTSSLRNSKVTSVSLGGISLSPKVTSISGLLSNMPDLENVDLSGFDVSHITDMGNLFYGDTKLTKVNFGNLDFANIQTSGMFDWSNGNNIKEINIANTKSIPQAIFNEYIRSLRNTNATSISFTGLNLSPDITSLAGALSNMASLKHADLTGLNLNNITNLAGIFTGDQNLESVNLSGLDFAKTNTSGMFNWAGNSIADVNITNTKNISSDILNEYVLSLKNTHAKTADLSNINLSAKVTSLAGLFSNMTDLESVNLTGLDTSHITDMSSMFYNTPKLTKIIGIENLDTHNVTNMGGMFESVINTNTNPQEFQSLNPHGSLTDLDLSNWDVSNVTNMSYMFGGQGKLTKLGDLSHWNTSNVTNMSGMFFGLNNLPDEALQNLNWDTSQVRDMSYMFARMTKQKDLSFVNNWNTSKVTDMSYMFFRDPALEKLDLSNWDTSSVGLKKTAQNYSLADMFANDISLTSVGDLSHWNTSNVHDTRAMFYDTPKLEQIDLSGWDTGKLEIAEGMFNYSGAKYIGLNNWDLSHIKRLNGNGLVNENGTLGGVENMFKNFYNNAVISMNNISLPDAKNAFVITDFAGTHPIVVIANGKNGEALPTLLAVNNQTWTDKNKNNVTGRQNSDILTFVRADNDQELSQHGLNFIFTNLSDMQDYFNQETGVNVVKTDLGDLVHDWDEKADTVDGHLKTANRVSPSASYDPYNNPNGIEDVVNGNTLASLMTSVYKLNIVSPKITIQTKKPTRTIIIENPDGTTSTKTQSVEFTRTITTHVDGTEQISNWTPAKGQWDKFDIPAIKDYDSYVDGTKATVIDAANVNVDTANVTVKVTYKSNVVKSTETKKPTRTIIIENPDGTTSTKTQSVEFTRTVTKHADGSIEYGAWTPAKGQWDSFDIPQINGYNSYVGQDQVSTIQAVSVDPSTANVTITVSYISIGDNNGGDDNTPIVPPVTPDTPRPLPEVPDQPVTPDKPTTDDDSNYPKPHGEKIPDKETVPTQTKQEVKYVAPKAIHISQESKSTSQEKEDKNTLPQTGEKQNNLGILGLALMALASLGLVDRKRRNK